MGKTKGPYKEEFPKDSTVQIADRAFLENFLKTWKLHHELEPQQLNYANKIAEVKSVGFYHGGDELYELKGVPGTWHEQCLRGRMTTTDAIIEAVALLRSRMDLGEIAIFRELASRGIERQTAARLVEFLPMVYCRLIFAKSGLLFPETYRRVLSDGTFSSSVSLSSETLWNQLREFAEAEINGGVKSQDLLAIAGRSAEFDAANKLLNSGSKLENLEFTEPVLLWPVSGPNS